MRSIRLTLERDGDSVCIFSDLAGFYLWSEDIERTLQSIVPLIQHLVWKNENKTIVPTEEPDFTDLLTTGSKNVEFTVCDGMREPKLLVKGRWWRSPEGAHFYLPVDDDKIPEKIMDRITKDLETE